MENPTVAQKFPIVRDMPAGAYHWCACGKSRNQPFCDGSHQGSGFVPRAVTLTEAAKVAWCACKHTKNPPFCDGTHKTV